MHGYIVFAVVLRDQFFITENFPSVEYKNGMGDCTEIM